MNELLKSRLTTAELRLLRNAEGMDWRRPVNSGDGLQLVFGILWIVIVGVLLTAIPAVRQVLEGPEKSFAVGLIPICLALAYYIRLYKTAALLRKITSILNEVTKVETEKT